MLRANFAAHTQMLRGPFRQQQKARRWGGDGDDWDTTAARVAGGVAWQQAGSARRGFILKPAWASTERTKAG